MPSQNGPYVIDTDNSVQYGADSFFVLKDKNGSAVIDFANGSASPLKERDEQSAQSIADQLSGDDTEYLALIRAHYLGGSVTQAAAQNVAEAILVLEAASFASDPAAIAAIGKLSLALLSL